MLGVALLGTGGVTYVTKIEPGRLDLTTVTLALPRLDPAFAGFRLLQISDIHLSDAVTAEQVSEVCKMALETRPDLVALTGDFVDKREELRRLLGDLSAALRPLTQSVQTVAILGNHDYRMGLTAIRKMLKDLQVQELTNQSLSLTRGGARLHIAGVDDVIWGRPRLQRVVEELPEEGAAILLAHEPDYADTSAKSGRFDLQLSGHSHGGQIVLPVVGAPVLPELGRKYPSGLYRVGNMYQYTNRGLGMTEPYIRFNCRPEIALFTLKGL